MVERSELKGVSYDYWTGAGTVEPHAIVKTDTEFGNGFIIDPLIDTVFTAAHVVAGADSVRICVRTSSGVDAWCHARVVAWEDQDGDLAALRLPYAFSGLSNSLRVGEFNEGEVVLVGYGSSRQWTKGDPMTRFDPCHAGASGPWLFYSGSPGGHGYSGGAVVSSDPGLVVGCHHGSPGTSANRATKLDWDLVNRLRNYAFELELKS